MYAKLAWRSFLKQFRNYAVYFLATTLAVMIYYSFSAMTFDQPLIKQAAQDVRIDGVLNTANVFVLIIVIFFVMSANRFFVQRRMREIALLRLFGLGRSRIIWQFLLETLALNVVSFITGVLLGIVFSKLFSMILVKAMALQVDSGFFISGQAMFVTFNVFSLVFIAIAFQMIWQVARSKLSDLTQHDQRLPMRKVQTSWISVLLGILGLLLIGGGYGIAIFSRRILVDTVTRPEELLIFIFVPFGVLLSCIIGTYLFFRFSLKLIFSLLEKLPWAAKKLRFYEFSKSRLAIQSNWRTLAAMTVITALAIAIIGTVVSVIALQNQQDNNNNPTDYQVAAEDYPQLKATLTEAGAVITDEVRLDYKTTAMNVDYRLFNTKAERKTELVSLLSLRDYRRLRRKIKELPAVTLQKGEGVLFDYSHDITSGIIDHSRHLELPNQQDLDLVHVYSNHLGDQNLRFGLSVLVVPEDFFERTQGYAYSLMMVDVAHASEEALSSKVDQNLPVNWDGEIYYHYQSTTSGLIGSIGKDPAIAASTGDDDFSGNYVKLNQQSRYPVIRRSRREAGIFIYVAAFIGVIVSAATASILTLRQIAKADAEKADYRLLLRLGVAKREIRRLIYRQKAWFFLPPMILIILHSTIAIYAWSQFVASDNYWLAFVFCGLTAFLYLGAYYLTVKFYIHTVEE